MSYSFQEIHLEGDDVKARCSEVTSAVVIEAEGSEFKIYGLQPDQAEQISGAFAERAGADPLADFHAAVDLVRERNGWPARAGR